MFNNRSASSNRKLLKFVKKSTRVVDVAYGVFKAKQVLSALYHFFADLDLS